MPIKNPVPCDVSNITLEEGRALISEGKFIYLKINENEYFQGIKKGEHWGAKFRHLNEKTMTYSFILTPITPEATVASREAHVERAMRFGMTREEAEVFNSRMIHYKWETVKVFIKLLRMPYIAAQIADLNSDRTYYVNRWKKMYPEADRILSKYNLRWDRVASMARTFRIFYANKLLDEKIFNELGIVLHYNDR